MNIIRAHRLGKIIHEKPQPIIASLMDFIDKEHAKKAGKELKKKPFGVSDDFSLAFRKARNKLVKDMA